MKLKKAFLIILCVLGVAACETTRPVVVPAPPADPCPLPGGYQLKPAVATAEQTLRTCPNKLDEVFSSLLEVAKNSPKKENASLIQDLLKGLVKENKISETYAKNLYKKYFSIKFVNVPDVKTYNLPSEIDAIKKQLRREKALKRIGLLECCNDRAGYKMAEAEYARVVNFMENLVLNERYTKSGQ